MKCPGAFLSVLLINRVRSPSEATIEQQERLSRQTIDVIITQHAAFPGSDETDEFLDLYGSLLHRPSPFSCGEAVTVSIDTTVNVRIRFRARQSRLAASGESPFVCGIKNESKIARGCSRGVAEPGHNDQPFH